MRLKFLLLTLGVAFFGHAAVAEERSLRDYKRIQCGKQQIEDILQNQPHHNIVCYRARNAPHKSGYTIRKENNFYMWVFNSGDFISDDFNLQNPQVHFSFSHNGGDEFRAEVFDARTNALIETLFHAQAETQAGSRTVKAQGPLYFKVTTNGSWYISAQ